MISYLFAAKSHCPTLSPADSSSFQAQNDTYLSKILFTDDDPDQRSLFDLLFEIVDLPNHSA